jgi:hypothetical protein
MSNRATVFGHIFEASGAWHTRLYIRVKGKRVQKSLRICRKDDLHPSKESVVLLATELVKQAQALATNREQIYTTGTCPTCGRFVNKKGKRESQCLTT